MIVCWRVTMSPSVVPVRQNWRFFVRITHYSRFGNAFSGEICGSAGDHNFVNDFLTRGSLSNVSNPFYNAAAERGLQFKSVSTALRFVPHYGSWNTSELVSIFCMLVIRGDITMRQHSRVAECSWHFGSSLMGGGSRSNFAW